MATIFDPVETLQAIKELTEDVDFSDSKLSEDDIIAYLEKSLEDVWMLADSTLFSLGLKESK